MPLLHKLLFILPYKSTPGKTTPDGRAIAEAGRRDQLPAQSRGRFAIVPFYAFGAEPSSSWYRLKRRNMQKEEIDQMLGLLRNALEKKKLLISFTVEEKRKTSILSDG